MGLTKEERKHLRSLLRGTSNAPVAQRMRHFKQHGKVSTYRHCRDVTAMCFFLNRRLHLGANEATLVRGAFLHDLYLYDWHEKTLPTNCMASTTRKRLWKMPNRIFS